MKVVYALLFLLVLGNSSFAEDFKNCCVCVADPQDEYSTNLECREWIKTQKQCQLGRTIPSKDTKLTDSGATCQKVTVYGAFHGSSYMARYPFQLSENAAQALHAKEVTYTGSTCLLFNNTKVVELQADLLAERNKTVKFQLSGNQNIGLVWQAKKFIWSKEISSEIYDASSKMSVIVDAGAASISYDKCSVPKKGCGYALGDVGSTNDSNSKICEHNGQLLEQRCCQRKQSNRGTWSEPGQFCDR